MDDGRVKVHGTGNIRQGSSSGQGTSNLQQQIKMDCQWDSWVGASSYRFEVQEKAEKLRQSIGDW